MTTERVARAVLVSSLMVLLSSMGCSGAAGIDVQTLPPDMRDSYALFAERCSKCHTIARPLAAEITEAEHWEYYVTRMRRMPGRRDMARAQRDVQKERSWGKVIREAARSGSSIREFCARRKIKESQFYWWQRKLRDQRADRARRRQPAKGREAATFALVSDEPRQLDAGIELVLSDGRRVRIGRGVDEATLRTVLSAVGSEPC